MALTGEELVRSPAWLPLEMQGAAVRMVNLDEAAYRAASFLDQRLLACGYAHQTCAAELLAAAAARLTPRAHYIFHTGHVGSTLISRLIGAHELFFSLREPALLRVLAASPAAAGAPSLCVTLALLARTWRPSQRAVVKVTSFVSELAEMILAESGQPCAVFMFARPLAYLQGIFAGDNSRLENRQLTPARLERLQRRLGGDSARPDPRSEGECIAMSWLCEMTALREAAARFASRVLWVDFDAFLREPVTGLRAILQRLGAAPADAELESLVRGPLMRQYSKAPEHAYDAALRRELLAGADHEHAAQIRRGLDWLHAVARRHPLAAAVLQ
jgi:hypothetical protein